MLPPVQRARKSSVWRKVEMVTKQDWTYDWP